MTDDAAELPWLDTAVALGARLSRRAIWHEDRCNWTGDVVADRETVVHRSMPGDLYTGTAGIGWFLLHLGAITGDDAAVATGRGALRHAVAWADRCEATSLYGGTLGVALAACSGGRRIDDEVLVERGATMAATAISDLATAPSTEWDLVGGLAGAVVALVAIGELLGRGPFLPAAASLAARLAALAEPAELGVAWPSAAPGAEPPLCGLAHGASGAALALLEAGRANGSTSHHELVDEAARYERAWYSRRERGWPDLRAFDGDDLGHDGSAGPPYLSFWCHGAPGIGVARLRRFELDGDLTAIAEAAAAIDASTVDLYRALQAHSASTVNLSLCHGVGSVTELHLAAHAVTGDTEHVDHARRLMGLAWKAAGAGRLACGVPGGGETPGLMLGVAGIGAAMLRLHDPASMPSPLLVAGWGRGPGEASSAVATA